VSRIASAAFIGTGMASFGPAGEALYLSVVPHHQSSLFIVFWIIAWTSLAYGIAWRLGSEQGS
jgi:hypothetical protein